VLIKNKDRMKEGRGHVSDEIVKIAFGSIGVLVRRRDLI